MKATGIIRRIDDLGRVVIPKEIRRTMRIKEGDPLEIFTDNEGGVTFRKYELHDLEYIGEIVCRGSDYCISNTTRVISRGFGIDQKFSGAVLSSTFLKELEDNMNRVKFVSAPFDLFPDDKLCCYPIKSQGYNSTDVVGCLFHDLYLPRSVDSGDSVSLNLVRVIRSYLENL